MILVIDCVDQYVVFCRSSQGCVWDATTDDLSSRCIYDYLCGFTSVIDDIIHRAVEETKIRKVRYGGDFIYNNFCLSERKGLVR